MDWLGWLVFGLMATGLLTAVMVVAQMLGLTRLDLPLLLGTMASDDVDRARVAGSAIHIGVGQVFALGYTAAFAALDQASWWLGAVFGLLHGTVALTVLVPTLPGLNGRIASNRAGPSSTAVLEPPGLLAMNYGVQTPVVTMLAHVCYGILLGLVLTP